MRPGLRELAFISSAAAAIFALTQATGAADETIKLGVLVPTSGGASIIGLPLVDGIQLAVDEINAAGGVNGKMIEFVVRDEQLKPDVAVAAAKDLIALQGVDALIGPATSGDALAVSEIAKAERIVMVTPSSSAASLTAEKLHDYIFQLPSTSDAQGKYYATLLQKIGAQKVCSIGFDYAFTKEFHGAMLESLPASITETNQYLLPLGATDYNTLISQLLADSCDTIVNTFYGGGFIAFVKQAQPYGLLETKKLVSAANNGDHAVASALQAGFPEGAWVNSHDAWYYNDLPELAKFHEDMAKVQGKKEIDMYPIAGYLTVKMLAAGIAKAGTADSDALVAALEGLTFDSPLGPLTVNPENHRVNKPDFYGQMATVPGSTVKQMSPVELVRYD